MFGSTTVFHVPKLENTPLAPPHHHKGWSGENAASSVPPSQGWTLYGAGVGWQWRCTRCHKPRKLSNQGVPISLCALAIKFAETMMGAELDHIVRRGKR